MQTDKSDMKIEQSVSIYSHALERPCKHQIVTDPKLRSASHINRGDEDYISVWKGFIYSSKPYSNIKYINIAIIH